MLFKILFYLYQIVLSLIVLLLKVIPPPLNRWHQLKLRSKSIPSKSELWFHGASRGECQAIIALIRDLEIPLKTEIFISCQTQSAYELLEKALTNSRENFRAKSVRLGFFPLDSMRLMKPSAKSLKAIILFESEFWPGQLRFAQKNKIPIYWISAKIKTSINKTLIHFLSDKSILDIKIQFADYQSQNAFKSLTFIDDFKSQKVAFGPIACLKLVSKTNVQERPFYGGLTKVNSLISVHKAEIPSLIANIKDTRLSKKLRREFENPLIDLVQNSQPHWVVVPRYPSEAVFFKEAFAQVGYSLMPFDAKYLESTQTQFMIVEEYGRVEEILKLSDEAWYGGSFYRKNSSLSKGVHNFFEALDLGVKVKVGPYHFPLAEDVEELKAIGVLSELPYKPVVNMRSVEEYNFVVDESISQERLNNERKDYLEFRDLKIKQRGVAIAWLEDHLRARL